MSGAAKSTLVRVGDFFFKWRDLLFPSLLLVLFLGFRPGEGLFGSQTLPKVVAILGVVLTAGGLSLRFAAIGWAYIIRGGKNKLVYAEDLVTGGYFATCRNPLYVGNILVYVGLFMVHGNPWVVIGGSAIFGFAYIAIVAAEEHFLRAKFGSAYEVYSARVARWIPDFSALRTSCAGMQFSATRSILKDRVTIFGAGLVIVVIFALQNHQIARDSGNMAGAPVGDLWFWAALAVLLVFVVTAPMAKNRLKREGKTAL